MDGSEPKLMQCMEVWGGNRVVDSGVVMAGLDAWVYSRPYGDSEGGGDLHYVSSCATGRITRLLLADVSGHGQAVSGVAGSLRNLMRRYVNYIDQSSFVRSMNEQFVAMSASDCFATAVVASFFAPTNELSLCNAGHPPPLIYRRKRREWSILTSKDSTETAGPANIPLGIVDIADYDRFDLRLDVGDLVVCYTDSLIESRDAAGELLGQEGLLRLAVLIDVSDATRVIPHLLELVAEEHEGNLMEDDVTVLLFRPNGLAPRPPLGKRLAAPFRLMGAILRAPFPGGQAIPWPEVSLRNLGAGMFEGRPRGDRT